MAGKPDWGFYGRDRDMDRLRECLGFDLEKDSGAFDYRYHVIGRRRVGKTRLLRRTMKRFGGDRPWIPVTMEVDSEGAAASADECLHELLDRVGMVDPALLDGLPPRRGSQRVVSYYVSVVRHLLRRGVVVTIDEFQRCEDNGIIGSLPETLDLMESGEDDPLKEGERWGTLIVMGSHQQRMLDIMGQDGPLYGRSELAVDLKPWSARTVLEVAAEHGLLARPGRFLTLWTAYQGMPDLWEGFVTGRNGALPGSNSACRRPAACTPRSLTWLAS